MNKSVLITGINGQDGSYLAELLLKKGYYVHGIIRRNSYENLSRINHIIKDINLHYGDVMDSNNLNKIIGQVKPDEVYNLAAQSHVGISFDLKEYTAEATGIGTLKILEAIHNRELDCKFYQASTSELFGGLPNTAPQNENTPFYPRSPYAAAKLYAYWITVNYREAYGMFTCNGILFNHESPRRGENFVTKKITKGVSAIVNHKQEKLFLGNLDAKRDWGYAGDYVEGMWLMLQQDCPDDYILATNETHTVREFAEMAFQEAGITITWDGNGIQEKGYDAVTGKVLVEVSEEFFRPSEVDLLWGDASKAERKLGWKRKVNFKGLVKMMMESELDKLKCQ